MNATTFAREQEPECVPSPSMLTNIHSSNSSTWRVRVLDDGHIAGVVQKKVHPKQSKLAGRPTYTQLLHHAPNT